MTTDLETNPASGETPAAPLASDVDALVKLLADDPPQLAASEIHGRAAALDQVSLARLMKRLRDEKIGRADDRNRFERGVRKAREDIAKAGRAAEREAAEQAERANHRPDDAEAWREKLRCRMTAHGSEVLPSFGNLCLFLEHTLKRRLTFDEMAAQPCLDGKPITDEGMSRIRRNLEHREDVDFSADNVQRAVMMIAKDQSFHPVKRYLRSLTWDRKERIAHVGPEMFGTSPGDSLSAKMIRRFFIALAARALNPGCKVDTVLVLVGPQGFLKSTLFDIIGGDWYSDSAVDLGDRKGIMTLHAAWVYEWPEIERVMAKRLNSEIKAFVSERHDTFVPMYGRGAVKLPRSCVIVGTTNEEQFLSDPTGSRRWWVVRVRRRIDAATIREWRDQLLAEAVHYYDQFGEAQCSGVPDDENPFRWWLNEAEEAEREARAGAHQAADAQAEVIERWLRGDKIKCNACGGTGERGGGENPPRCHACHGLGYFKAPPCHKDAKDRSFRTIAEVLEGALQVPPERYQSSTPRTAGTLRRLGWGPGEDDHRPRIGGAKVTPYYEPEGWNDPAV